MLSCVKQPDIPDTTTEVQGYVTNTAGDTMVGYGVSIFLTDKYTGNPDIRGPEYTDTTILTDIHGHYYIKKKLDKYKEFLYSVAASTNLKYADSVYNEIKPGNTYHFNLVIFRVKNYIVINGKVLDILNNILNNVTVDLIAISKPENDHIISKETSTDSIGNFHFEFQWTDTVGLNYKVNVPQTAKYQASDDYWVKWGVDNYFNIMLQPLN